MFNYFSHTQDMNARFLITDIVRAIKNKEVFKTSVDNIMRDFITPPDFHNLIQSIIDFRSVNMALDCYTKSSVSKLDLLSKLKNIFNLQYSFERMPKIIDATGVKQCYYSVNRSANKIGYIPKNTSLDGVVEEIYFLLRD